MAAANFTKDGKHKTIEQLFCSADFARGINNQLIFLSSLDIFLSITAFLGNTLILVALHKESSLHSPSKLLLRSLAATDLCVGLISEPLSVTFMMSLVNKRLDICHHALIAGYMASFIFSAVSLATLTAISVDRLLALLLGLRYRQVVTLKRTYVIVITIWTVIIANAAMSFWNHLITMWVAKTGLALCLLTSVFSYTKIFLTLRHHQTQVHHSNTHEEQPNQVAPLNITRYRKAVSTALWLQLTLVVCYLPFGIVDATTTISGISSSFFVVREFTVSLIYFNSSLNPILYCWKIEEVRQAVKETIRRLCCL